MLDSTGYTRTERVECFMCERVHWEFKAYTPQVGHCGEKLNVGTCIENGATGSKMKNFTGSKLFLIEKFSGESADSKDRHLNVSEYELKYSHQPYHYNGDKMPDFGHYLGQVVWVCAGCVKHYEVEAIKTNSAFLEIMDDAIWDHIQEAYGNISGVLLTFGVLSTTCRPKTLKSMPENLMNWAKKTIAKLSNTVRGANPKWLHKGAVRGVKELYNLLHKPQLKIARKH